MNLVILGLVSDIFGVFILFLVAIFDYPHMRFIIKKNGGKDTIGKVGDLSLKCILQIKNQNGELNGILW